MAVFRPCIGCTARNDCDIKKAVVKALKGQPITSAKIKCLLPFTRYFPPGTRVEVMVWDHQDFDGHRGEVPAKYVPSTVVGPSTKKAGKLLMHLDTPVFLADERTTEFRAAWPKEVKKLDEPIRDACSSCRRAYVHGTCSCLPDCGY